ncbi:diguanylate cyclase domain-containing protein [Coralloluteibacterium thermophilus]|uniref:Diguanylate cyclase domain-containing protein n=1 Tax=Coralloluteibacterium thermophilum TaxID=2707049 RepID=A0ABV9NQ65_9GAMM
MHPPELRLSRSFLVLAPAFFALGGLAAAFALLVFLLGGESATLWLGNPLAIGLALRLHRRAAIVAVASVGLGELAAGLAFGLGLPTALPLAAVNLMQVVAGLWVLRRLGIVPGRLPDFAGFTWTLGLLGFVLPALNAGLLIGILTLEGAPAERFFTYWSSNAVSMLLVLPMMLAWRSEPADVARGRGEPLVLVALAMGVAALATGLFGQPYVLVLLPLLLTAFRTGVFWTAAACAASLGVVVGLRLAGLQGWLHAEPGSALGVGETHFYAAVTVLVPLYVSLLLARARAAEAHRRQAQRQLRSIADNLPALVAYVDADMRYQFANARYRDWYGREPSDLIGRTPAEIFEPGLAAVVEDSLRRCLTGERVTSERALPSGRFVHAIYEPDLGDGTVAGAFILVNDISERRAMEEDLFREKERAEITLNSIGDGVAVVDAGGRVRSLNPAARALAVRGDEALGRAVEDVLPLYDALTGAPVPSPLREAMRANRAVEPGADVDLLRGDGVRMAVDHSAAPVHDRSGRVVGGVMVFHDIGETRALRERLAHLARHDPLTGLPNRTVLTERLAQALALARRSERTLALMFLDMDRFKAVNDELGHAAGDALLAQVAARLVGAARRSDTVCRQGGDEFIVLMPDVDGPDGARAMARRLLDACAEPYLVEGHRLHILFSIGVALFPGDGEDAETLMRNADTAMYRAKLDGGSRYRLHDATLDAGQ